MELNDKEKKPIFKANAVERGSGLAVQLPIELIEYLQLNKNDKVGWVAENGKYGHYVALFKIEELLEE